VAEVTVLNYGIGNTGSIINMLRKLHVDAAVATETRAVETAKRLVLPGIGAFDACMQALQNSGLRDAVLEFAASSRPLLGICVGMQMLTAGSEEGSLAGLGLIRAYTRKFPAQEGLRIPHMGWDTVRWTAPQHMLARELTHDSRFYFVHSYCVTCESPVDALGLCTYGSEFAAAIASGAVAGVQFHPEKSHRFGLQLLKNFATA
jgi:glutamine amidotransferase